MYDLAQDHATKVQHLREKMLEHGVDAAVIRDWKHVYYFTGFRPAIRSRPIHFFVFADSPPVLMVPNLMLQTIRDEFSFLPRYTSYMKPSDLLPDSAAILTGGGREIRKIGLEGGYFPYGDAQGLIRLLGGNVCLWDVEPSIEAMRVIKTPHEVELIRKACGIADNVVVECLRGVRPGVTEEGLARHISARTYEAGGDGVAFDTIVVSGDRGGLLSTAPSARLVQAGEQILVDYGALYQGYCCDIARMASLGPPSRKLADFYKAEMEALDAMVTATRPGVLASDLCRVALKVLAKYGYDKYRRGERVGHGVGLGFHEAPLLGLFDDTVLEPGMVISMEPTIQAPEMNVRIEDEILVTGSGCEVMTTMSRDLIIA